MGTEAEGRDRLGADKMIDKEKFHAALKAKKGNEGNDESRSGRKQLEAFDRKQTNWGGLWFHSEYNGFSSEVINLAELRKFKGKVRLYVRKNKFFNNGENGRPNYCFCLKDADSETFWTPEIEEDDSVFRKIEKLKEVMQEGNLNGDRMMLPSESVGCAKRLMEEAIKLVEEITGEEWNFTAITY